MKILAVFFIPASICAFFYGAFGMVDGMTREEFITFGSANRTTDQFINDGWNPLVAFNYENV